MKRILIEVIVIAALLTAVALLMSYWGTAHAQQLWTGCVPVAPSATATSTPAPTTTPTATPTPALNPFSTIQVPNILPGWPVNTSQAIFWSVFDLRTVKSVNVFVNGVKIPNQQFGMPANSNSWVYQSSTGSVQGTVFYAPPAVGQSTFTFIAYGSLDTSQPLNQPSGFAVPPTSVVRTITP